MYIHLLQIDSTGINQVANGVVNTPESFFTIESFTTLAGATGVVYIVCGAIQRVSNKSPKWLALLVSLVVSFISAFISKSMIKQGTGVPPLADWIRYLIAVLNGLLIFMSSTGTNQVLAPEDKGKDQNPSDPAALQKQSETRSFRASWWK